MILSRCFVKGNERTIWTSLAAFSHITERVGVKTSWKKTREMLCYVKLCHLKYVDLAKLKNQATGTVFFYRLIKLTQNKRECLFQLLFLWLGFLCFVWCSVLSLNNLKIYKTKAVKNKSEKMLLYSSGTFLS